MLGWSVASLAMLSACAQTSPPMSRDDERPGFIITKDQPRVPDEYLITLTPETDTGIISKYFRRFGIKDIYSLGGETYLLVLLNDPGPRKMEAVIDDDARVRAVQPNLVYWDNRSGSIIK